MNRNKTKTEFPEVKDALHRACKGLFYPSETDAPIVPFFGARTEGGTREKIVRELGLSEGDEVEERPFIEFFSRLTRIQDWFAAPEIENAERFVKLQKLLEGNLKYLTVLRTGRIQIDIYVVGIDSDGNVAGIKTKAVET